ncbi:ABC transporter ATP-binding protein [Herbiconiux sp. CPCC 205763]|uniref:ABC transporter ATP-binding protein n=1 Tax=Herbiconiux aconitum TaxID=2970913 RepID=A0ABT2GTY7_9MICO|nr:ABC transporter ATP-binding protein [Herbiconiux aconitum]MCS5719628.1 ABC transporter ATP-binding protein [Herbiconiux aconitum]
MTVESTASVDPHILCVDLVRIFSTRGVEVQALQGLNLRVEPGEIVAVIGASGSGKSTLLSILSGLDTPTAGSASVAGHDLLSMGGRERVQFQRGSVGFVWQQTSKNLLPYLTAAENIEAVTAIARSGAARDRRRRTDELVELLELGDIRNRRPDQLSGGQQQRVAIAVAIANEPRVLLADEPTGELDEASSVDVLDALRSVNESRGVTTLIVTHDPSVSSHVRRTVQIRDGRTSTEVLRSTRIADDGSEHAVAEEFAVLDRVGRLQLPENFTTELGLRDRVRLALESDHVGVYSGDSAAPPRALNRTTRPRSTVETVPTPAPAVEASASPGYPTEPASVPRRRARHAGPLEQPATPQEETP